MQGGLYDVISRGNNRRKVFRTSSDYRRFTEIMQAQKSRTPFYLYAYCLMPNHIHLLIERREDSISKIMQRVLTSYSQYHNRKYNKIGHVFQGRYKSILCQTDGYLGELVRYIHLNPVRARMVRQAEEYEYSGHGEYIGMEGSGLVDVEPVLRHFGGTKRRAIEVYRRFVEAATGDKRREEYYRATEGRMLGSEEFVKEVKHRVGEFGRSVKGTGGVSLAELLKTAERVSGLKREEICSGSKRRETVAMKEAVIVLGRRSGIANKELAAALGIDPSAVTKRMEAARLREGENAGLRKLQAALATNDARSGGTSKGVEK
jgi:putative transposase